jgi:CitMHS family citrate-Mg2+:H+ or citrate-Ca2+:H+ symporter
MLTVIGFSIIVLIVVLLMTGKANPIIAMSAIPVIGAFCAGYGITDISGFIEHGLRKVSPVATMFLFAIIFFSLMKDLNVFTPLIRMMIGITKGNVVIVTMVTALTAAVVHLDGSGAATFLIIIPAFLPLYTRLGINPYLMLLIMCMSMGVMNMVPWGGPLGRASAVTEIPASTLWQSIIPVQIIGVAFATIIAGIFGYRESIRIKKNLAGKFIDAHIESNSMIFDSIGQDKEAQKPFLNFSLIIFSILMLAFGLLPASYVFMIALSLALLLNYPSPKTQMNIIMKHAPQAVNMVAIIMSAGVFLGVMDKGGMLNSLATHVLYVIPEKFIPILHVLVGVLGVPLDIFTSTDAYYFALLPIVSDIVGTVGISPQSVVYAMAIGNNAGTFISPFSPAVWLGVGLAGLDMGKHIRYSFLWIWLFSFIPLSAGYFLGLY